MLFRSLVCQAVKLISRNIFYLLVIVFDADFPYFFVDGDETFLQMFVEPGLFAGERGTLKTKIDTLLTETIPDMATFEQGTCLFAATVAFGFREIMQHNFETLVVFEDWFVEHGDEALGINIEVTQAFDEFEIGRAHV